jgi:hypothetical protein
MKTELRHSLNGIRRLCNKKHILLGADDCSQSLAEDRMILYAQDSYWFGMNHSDAFVGGF